MNNGLMWRGLEKGDKSKPERAVYDLAQIT